MSQPSETRNGGGPRRRRRGPRRAAATEEGFEGRGTLHRHLRLVGVQLRIRVLAALEYRAGFWTSGVLGMFWSFGGVVPLLVALEHRPDVAGWNPWALAMLVGCHMIVNGLFGAVMVPALFAAMEDIRTGALDYTLLRPVDALVSCLVADFQPWNLLESVVGLGLLMVAASATHASPGPLGVAMFVVVLGSGIVALYALSVLILAFAFRALQLQNLAYLLESLLDFARWPISVFRGPLKAVFTFVIPFAIMTSYPPMALMGWLEPSAALGAVATAAALGLVAWFAWRTALRGYTSASS
jgi:ABC-2 type transport system permease protein